MSFENHFHERQSRRAALKKLGMVVGAGLGIGTGLFSSLGTTFASSNPIKHVVILCQENRTFDHYFGYYARSGQYGVPVCWISMGLAGSVIIWALAQERLRALTACLSSANGSPIAACISWKQNTITISTTILCRR
jgi:phospholipase C